MFWKGQGYTKPFKSLVLNNQMLSVENISGVLIFKM